MLQYGKPPVLIVIAVISLVYGWSILLDIPTVYAKDLKTGTHYLAGMYFHRYFSFKFCS